MEEVVTQLLSNVQKLHFCSIVVVIQLRRSSTIVAIMTFSNCKLICCHVVLTKFALFQFIAIQTMVANNCMQFSMKQHIWLLDIWNHKRQVGATVVIGIVELTNSTAVYSRRFGSKWVYRRHCPPMYFSYTYTRPAIKKQCRILQVVLPCGMKG